MGSQEMLSASCHCGAVVLKIARKPRSLTECNCSICRRYAARWAYYTRKSVRVTGATETYRWGDESIEFHRCRDCGCVTHYVGVGRSADGRLAVNARMLEPRDVADLVVRRFDGAETWRYLDE